MSNTFPKEKIFQRSKVRLHCLDSVIHEVYLTYMALSSSAFVVCFDVFTSALDLKEFYIYNIQLVNLEQAEFNFLNKNTRKSQPLQTYRECDIGYLLL